MNTTAITGTVTTIPRYRIRAFVPTTAFDVRVDFARRAYTFRISALNDLARTAQTIQVGDHVAITGYLHLEPASTDPTALHFEIVAYEIDHQPGHPAEGGDQSQTSENEL